MSRPLFPFTRQQRTSFHPRSLEETLDNASLEEGCSPSGDTKDEPGSIWMLLCLRKGDKPEDAGDSHPGVFCSPAGRHRKRRDAFQEKLLGRPWVCTNLRPRVCWVQSFQINLKVRPHSDRLSVIRTPVSRVYWGFWYARRTTTRMRTRHLWYALETILVCVYTHQVRRPDRLGGIVNTIPQGFFVFTVNSYAG